MHEYSYVLHAAEVRTAHFRCVDLHFETGEQNRGSEVHTSEVRKCEFERQKKNRHPTFDGEL